MKDICAKVNIVLRFTITTHLQTKLTDGEILTVIKLISLIKP